MKRIAVVLGMTVGLSAAPIAVSSAEAQAVTCKEVPARVNASKGDILLKKGGGGLIARLLESVGEEYSHTGMLVTNSSIRHNTMHDKEIEVETSWGVPYKLKATGYKSLRDGYPGTITETLTNAFYFGAFSRNDALVLTNSDTRKRYAGANKMSELNGWYSLYGYSTSSWSNPYTKHGGSGAQCSSTIQTAHTLAGNEGFVTKNYTAAARNAAAQVLYTNVYNAGIKKSLPGWLAKAYASLITFDSASQIRRDVSKRVANQVVNCMAFNDCGNTGDRWRSGVGSADAFSPDQLMNLVKVNNLYEWLTGRPSQFAYRTIKPMTVSGGYYECTEPEPPPGGEYL